MKQNRQQNEILLLQEKQRIFPSVNIRKVIYKNEKQKVIASQNKAEYLL